MRKADTVEGVTLERAAELLAEKRAAGPAKKGGRAREEDRREEVDEEDDREEDGREDPLRLLTVRTGGTHRLAAAGVSRPSRRRSATARGSRPSSGS